MRVISGPGLSVVPLRSPLLAAPVDVVPATFLNADGVVNDPVPAVSDCDRVVLRYGSADGDDAGNVLLVLAAGFSVLPSGNADAGGGVNVPEPDAVRSAGLDVAVDP